MIQYQKSFHENCQLRSLFVLLILTMVVLWSTSMSFAIVRPPVQVKIGSTDELIVGKQMTVRVSMVGADLADVRLEMILPPEGWQFVGGQVTWTGTLQAGQPVEFEYYVIPTVDNSEPIRHRLSVPGWGDTDWFMDMNPKVPQAPSQSILSPSPSSPGIGPLASATVTATGRFVYYDDGNRTIGIRNAKVRLYDTDWFFPCDPLFLCRELMGEGVTDAGGYFTVTGTGSDWFGDLPDPYVEVVAEHSGVVVQTAGLINSTYCFKSGYKNNATDGESIDFGTLSTSEWGIYPEQGEGAGCDGSIVGGNGAWQLYNNAVEAWESVRGFSLVNPGQSGWDTGGEIPQVRVFWPDFDSFYRVPIPLIDSGGISIHMDDTWTEATIMHEYGHHVLQHFAESPVPFYNNGNCDGTPIPFIDDGHCLWWSENGSIHWTEGWPDFLSAALTRYWEWMNNRAYDHYWFEGPDHPHPDSNFPMIEGYTAAVLWDQHDTNVDNHDGNNSRDNLSQGFEVAWDVLVNYDPAPSDAGHNHPVTIQEFCQGYASRYPDLANRLAEIFHENHMTCNNGSDLQVTALSNPPASLTPGGSFTVTDTTGNFGDVSTGENSITRYYLSTDATITTGDMFIGERPVGNLAPAGGTSTGSVTVSVPAWVRGTYYLGACADAPANLFESNEENNCRASGQVLVDDRFDYAIANSGDIDVVYWGPGFDSGSNTITLTHLSGLTEPVSLAVSGLPAGASASFTNNPCNPTCSSTLTISVSRSTPFGTFPISVTGTPLVKTTTFNLKVTSPQLPALCVGPTSLSFAATQGGPAPSSQTLGVWNCGGQTLGWEVSGDQPWLSLSPTSGSSYGETDSVTVAVNMTGLAPGTYSATISIDGGLIFVGRTTVPVTLTVKPTIPAIGPDLTGTWNSASQSCRRGKCKLRGSVRVWNQGNATAPPSRLRVLLSNDAVLDPSDAVLHESSIGSLRPGRRQARSVTVPLPMGVIVSGQYLLAVIDALNSVPEIDETNNAPMAGPIP